LQAVNDGVMLDIPKNISQQNIGYLYPHDFGGYVKQNYLCKPLKFVELKDIGYEQKMNEWNKKIKEI